jgi:FKBP-type peptidyl-prolyl cis-trans isomerase (trigger factor)
LTRIAQYEYSWYPRPMTDEHTVAAQRSSHHLHNIVKESEKGSVVCITGTLDREFLVRERVHMLEILAHQVDIPGFRPGAAPEAMLVAKLGETYIQEKTAHHALDHDLPHILVDNGVMPIMPPSVSITLNTDGTTSVTIRAVVYPTITLPNYAEIAHTVMSGRTDVRVSEEEVLDALTHFKRERMRIEAIEGGSTNEAALKVAEATAVESLPPLDEAFVKQIGFDTVAAFEAHVSKELHAGKTEQARSERRAKMLKAICEKEIADVPEPLIEYEIAKMEAGLGDYLARANGTQHSSPAALEAYYTQIGKTREHMHTEWRAEATTRAMHQLALIEIAKRENINEDAKELDALVESVVKRQPDADKQAVIAHYQVILRNEKVMEWLEGK